MHLSRHTLLQHVAVCCSVLQCVHACCGAMSAQPPVVHDSWHTVLQFVAVCCSVAMCAFILRCNIIAASSNSSNEHVRCSECIRIAV
mmetsp:Transcript_43540/g.69933  ORF Transcript_43540/g.69933 Transcript_43540/m.69933 type:complete len:87 (-) Transcript_43540:136-396(-)